MSISLPVRSWLLTGQHSCALRIVLSSLLLVVASFVLGCDGSTGSDDGSAELISDDTITRRTLEVTLPPDFDPDDIARMELSVTGPGVPADLQHIPLDVHIETLGDGAILAFADTTGIPPGIDRVFTLQAFPTRVTLIPHLLGQETVDLEEGMNTEVVMTLHSAVVQLDVQPSFVDIEVGDPQAFHAIGHFGADCITNDPATCVILLRSDLTSFAQWAVISPAGHPPIATITNGSEYPGLAFSTIPGSAAIRATVEVLDGSATLNVHRATDTPSLFFTVAGFAVSEGDEGTKEVNLTVKLSMPPHNTAVVSVDVTTDDPVVTALSATAHEDYIPIDDGILTFAPGETEKTMRISLNGDAVSEDDESFRVVLSNPQPAGVQLLTSNATITILNDD